MAVPGLGVIPTAVLPRLNPPDSLELPLVNTRLGDNYLRAHLSLEGQYWEYKGSHTLANYSPEEPLTLLPYSSFNFLTRNMAPFIVKGPPRAGAGAEAPVVPTRLDIRDFVKIEDQFSLYIQALRMLSRRSSQY